MVLTSGGAALLPHARACLAAAASAVLEFADRSGLLSGAFALGTVGGLEGTGIPRLLGEYHRRYPRVAVSLIGASSPSPLVKVRDGEIDAAVVAGPPDGEPAAVASRVLLEDRIVAVLPAGSRPANRPMTLDEAVRSPVISYGPDSGVHAFIRAAFAAEELRLDIAYGTNDVALQLALVAERIGVALTSHASPVLAADRRFVVVPLEPAIRLRKMFVWRAGTRPSAPLRAFLDLWTELSDRPARDGAVPGATTGG
ncbi:LysR family transcriptional regulator substrate-binding protein [Kitasatospora sp. NPDC087314]|uniref:LysR family transcriptional regulator substrate-binding protein n=1 Tax=Kitasatospora sp. NPDC087314 TaxID=3364068 RepID=UPI0037F88BD3